MNELEFKERILNGEDLHTDFKKKLTDNEELARGIVCFANTDGGQIIIGVRDNGEIPGLDKKEIDETIRRIDDVAFNRCEPPCTVVTETLIVDEKNIIIVNVPKGEQRPYRTGSGLYYIRSANRCRQASREELLRLFHATESIYYDEIEIFKASIKDIDINFSKKFLEKYFGLEVEDENLMHYLINIKALSRNKKPTLAGIMFFAENPQFYVPTSNIITAYIDGNDISIPPSDKKEIDGKIPQMLEDCIRFLRIYIKEKHIIKGLENEKYPEIEDFVLREALVNSVAHRDYTISAPIRVFIFNDRIEFRTPGKLPNTVNIENLKIGAAHVLRNPTIYILLSKMGLVTHTGTGIKRIIESVKKTTGRNVNLEVIGNEFILTIPRW
ncbi:MAG: RNA-binding domain-containing protein [bacterium]